MKSKKLFKKLLFLLKSANGTKTLTKPKLVYIKKYKLSTYIVILYKPLSLSKYL